MAAKRTLPTGGPRGKRQLPGNPLGMRILPRETKPMGGRANPPKPIRKRSK